MRQSGVVTDVRRLGPHDHVCWGFDDGSAFRAAALTDARPGARALVPVDGQYVTDLVRQPARLDAFTRHEHRVDHLMADSPFSAMCAYNREVRALNWDDVRIEGVS